MKQTVDIEELVYWAYGRQKAHMAMRSGPAQCGPQAYGSAWVGFARLLELGTLIDSSGAGGNHCGGGSENCPADALTIHARALALPADAFWLVYHHGLAMTRPDWHPEGPGERVPLLDGRGRRKPIYRDAVNRSGIIGYQMCWRGTLPESVALGRAEYTMWHESLTLLVDDLADRLDDFTPQTLRCNAAPWLCGDQS